MGGFLAVTDSLDFFSFITWLRKNNKSIIIIIIHHWLDKIILVHFKAPISQCNKTMKTKVYTNGNEIRKVWKVKIKDVKNIFKRK